jgi:hypothetical protein
VCIRCRLARAVLRTCALRVRMQVVGSAEGFERINWRKGKVETKPTIFIMRKKKQTQD